MIWLGVTTVVVCIWLFREKLPYMKVSLILGLALCAALFWADVDAQVARHNVRAWQDGRLETVDVKYLSTLSSGAVPYLDELAKSEDPHVARAAHEALRVYRLYKYSDLRGWNLTEARAAEIIEVYQPTEEAEE